MWNRRTITHHVALTTGAAEKRSESSREKRWFRGKEGREEEEKKGGERKKRKETDGEHEIPLTPEHGPVGLSSFSCTWQHDPFLSTVNKRSRSSV